MYGIHKKTLSAKLFILVVQILYLIIASILITRSTSISELIKITLFIFLLVTFIRLNAMMFIWLPRGISWQEAIGNSLAFGIYYLGFPTLAIWGTQQFNLLYILGVFLFIIGSLINTLSELLRKPFKDNPNNQGKLYTQGLFKYAIHINYFGDILWVLGFALITTNIYALLIPLFLTIMFVTSYIPNSDKYLANKYGEDFINYQKHTKKLIPYIW